MTFGADDLLRAQDFARAQNGKPYIWGAVGPKGYDCSGFQSAILNVLEGRSNIHTRRFGTGTIGDSFEDLGLLEGQGGGGDFSLGVMFPGRSIDGIGHTAGRLGDLAVECRGGDGVVVGPAARSDTHPLFRHQFHAQVAMIIPEDDDMQPFSFAISGTNPTMHAYVIPDGTVIDGLSDSADGLGAFKAVYERKNANARQVDIVQSKVRQARGGT